MAEGAARLNARYKDWEIVPGANFAGLKLDRSPDATVTAGYTYTRALSNGGAVAANVHTRYVEKYALTSTALRAQFWQPGFTRTAVSLTYTAPGGSEYVEGYVRNIENTIAVTSVGVAPGFPGLNDGTVSVSDPRTFGLSLGVKF